METGRDHGLPEGDAIRDVGGQDDHVRTRGPELAHDGGPAGQDEVVGDPGDDRDARVDRRRGGRVSDRGCVIVPRGHDREAELRRRPAEPRRKLLRGERGGVRAEVRAARPDAEDEREPPPGQAVGNRPGLPVEHPGRVGCRAGRDGEVGRVGAHDEADPVGPQRGHHVRRLVRALEVAHVELDPPPRHAAGRVHEVGRDLDAAELLASERRGAARDREDGADPDRGRARGCRGRAGGTAGQRK